MNQITSRLLAAIAAVVCSATLVACGSEASQHALNGKAGKSIEAAKDMAEDNAKYTFKNMGDGYVVLNAGQYNYPAGNFLPREEKVDYVNMTVPLGYGNYDPKDKALVKNLQFFVNHYPEDVAKEFLANVHFPLLQSMTGDEKQKAMKNPEVESVVERVYAESKKLPRDVTVAVEFDRYNLTYNKKKNRFEFAGDMSPRPNVFLANASDLMSQRMSENVNIEVLGLKNIHGTPDDVKNIYPDLSDDIQESEKLFGFTANKEKTNKLAQWLENNSANGLTYKVNGRIAKAVLNKSLTGGEMLIVPDSLSVFTPDGDLIATVTRGMVIPQYMYGGSLINKWAEGKLDNPRAYYVNVGSVEK